MAPGRGSSPVASAVAACTVGGCGDRGVCLGVAGRLCSGDGGATAEGSVAEPGVPQRRGLGRGLPWSAVLAVQWLAEIFLLSRFHRWQRGLAARARIAGAAPGVSGRSASACGFSPGAGGDADGGGAAAVLVRLRSEEHT